ncbi:MAG: hypothetical protein JSS22_23400 [Proteobacteria bacterium]|nr:hypothetical protein [Pseudomonadota bacterium]
MLNTAGDLVRAQGRISLTGCPLNRQQLDLTQLADGACLGFLDQETLTCFVILMRMLDANKKAGVSAGFSLFRNR